MTSGAILIASGRVPKMDRVLIGALINFITIAGASIELSYLNAPAWSQLSNCFKILKK
jgi:hypothetical protein